MLVGCSYREVMAPFRGEGKEKSSKDTETEEKKKRRFS